MTCALWLRDRARLQNLQLTVSSDEVDPYTWATGPVVPRPPRLPPEPGRLRVIDRRPGFVPRETSAELPHWFGDLRAPAVRIAGRVVGSSEGGRAPRTVRLAIDVPDPGIWSGRDVRVTDDGSFEFGAMRPGAYLLVATGFGKISSVTRIDTRAPVAPITLVLAPCTWVEGDVPPPAQPAAADAPLFEVIVELAGREVGRADASGHWSTCAQAPSDLVLRAPGYDVDDDDWDRGSRSVLRPQFVTSGVVFEADGGLARNVAVQPIWHVEPYTSSDLSCWPGHTVVTTDGDGRFRYAGRPEICGLRILRGWTAHEVKYPRDRYAPPEPGRASLVSRPAAGGGEHLMIRLASERPPLDFASRASCAREPAYVR